MYQMQRKLADIKLCKNTGERLHMPGLCSSGAEDKNNEGEEQINKKKSRSRLSLINGLSCLGLIIGVGFLEGSCPLVGIPIMLLALVWLGHVAYHSNKGA